MEDYLFISVLHRFDTNLISFIMCIYIMKLSIKLMIQAPENLASYH